MHKLLNKFIPYLFWLFAIITAGCYYYQLDYLLIFKPLLLPVLFVYLLINDKQIGKPYFKLYFYIGLLFAYFGDIFLIIVSDTFFLTGMIAFLLMNIGYSLYFFHYFHFSKKLAPFLLLQIIVIGAISYNIFGILDQGLGLYRIPVIVYIVFISLLFLLIINSARNTTIKPLVLRYFIPAITFLIIQNCLIVLNKFQDGIIGDNNGFVLTIYCLAQFLFVRGFAKVHQLVK